MENYTQLCSSIASQHIPKNDGRRIILTEVKSENIIETTNGIFVALSSCAEIFFCAEIFMGGIIVIPPTPPPIFFVTHDETNQAMNKLDKSNHMYHIEQCVSKKTNEAMCSKSDRSYNM